MPVNKLCGSSREGPEDKSPQTDLRAASSGEYTAYSELIRALWGRLKILTGGKRRYLRMQGAGRIQV